jgi:hypothetical protein
MVAGVAVGIALGSAPVAGQGFTAEARGGPSFPAGDLAEVTDVGFNLGVGLGWALSGRLALRADGDFELLNDDARAGALLPRTFLWHYHGGLDLGLTDPAADWLIRVRGGAGGTTYDTERFQDGSPGILHSAFSVSGGLSVGHRWVDAMEIGVLGRGFVAFLDRERTQRLEDLNPAVVNSFSKASSFPVSIYFRWIGMSPM